MTSEYTGSSGSNNRTSGTGTSDPLLPENQDYWLKNDLNGSYFVPALVNRELLIEMAEAAGMTPEEFMMLGRVTMGQTTGQGYAGVLSDEAFALFKFTTE